MEYQHSLSIKDFAETFGADEDEVSRFCGDLIKSRDFKYTICPPKTREAIFLEVIKKCDNSEFSISGEQRKSEWRRGWGENLEDLSNSGSELRALIPRYWRGGRPMRFKGNYILASSGSFERDFGDIFKSWLFGKYFGEYHNIYDFGCGTGYDLVFMAKMFPEKELFGMDWVPESQKLLAAVADKYRWKMKGESFDLFHPDYNLEILPDSVVYTSSSLEQLGSSSDEFTEYLLSKRPSLCVNVECLAEYYDADKLFDYVALKYHKSRNYLQGFLTRLKGLEKEGRVKIISNRRTGFGSLYHEAYMYVVWQVL